MPAAIKISPNGVTLLVATSVGVYAYKYPGLTESWSIPLGGALSTQFSPDGGTFYIVDGGDAVYMLDAVDGNLIALLEAEGQSLWSLAGSPDGMTLLAGSESGDIWEWDLDTRAKTERWNATSGGIVAIDYAPDGASVAIGSSDGTISVWDTSSGRMMYAVSGGDKGVGDVAFSPNGSVLASGGGDGSIKLWDTATGELLPTLEGHTNGVRRLAFSPAADLLASASYDGTIRIWRLLDTSPVASFPGYAGSPDVVFQPDGSRILAPDDQVNITAWDAKNQTPAFHLQGFTNRMGALATSAHGPSLASCSIDELGRVLEVLVWDVGDPRADSAQLPERLSRRIPGSGPSIAGCALVLFDSNGAGVIAAQYDGSVTRWSRLSDSPRSVLAALAGDCYYSFAASMSSNPVVARSCLGYVETFDATTGAKKWDFTGEVVSSLALSREGSVLAAGTVGGDIVLLDAIQGSLERTLHAGEGPVDAMGFSPDGTLIAAANHDGSVETWDTAAGRRTARYAGRYAPPVAVVVSDSDRFAVAYEDGYVQVATSEGAMLSEFQASSEPAFGLAFLDGGKMLATASADGSIVLWPVP